MPNEGDLKQRWTRWARKQDLKVKPLGPHQIAGMPDLLVHDPGESEVIAGFCRTRQHWIEAKPTNPGPYAFKAKRDATPAQVRWLKEFAACGIPTWWLILNSEGWALIPGTETVLKRDDWAKKMRPYGAKIHELVDSDSLRKSLVDERKKAIARIEQEVIKLYAKKAA